MTVREAFAKAGHPVPDGARVGLSGRDWFYSVDCRRASVFSAAAGGWLTPPNSGYLDIRVDLSNLPALDACNALPECVQKVVSA